jgi:hypothetical protein
MTPFGRHAFYDNRYSQANTNSREKLERRDKISYICTCNKIRMQTKLTLTVDQEVIELAKEYARDNAKSLSSIVEEYLKSLSSRNASKSKRKYSKLIWELKGSVKIDSSKVDYKELLEDALIEKHLR